MGRLVAQIGKGSIAGDYHNPFGVRVDPLFVLHEAELGEDAAEAKVTRTQLPREVYSEKDFEREKKKRERRPRPAGKISPGLIDLMERSKPRDILEIIVTLADDDGIRVPLLPDVEEEERDRRIPELEWMVASFAERRSAAQRAFLERAKFRDEPKVLEHFWITNAIALAVQRAEITRLARLDEVVYLQPVFGGESPPADSEPGNDAIFARETTLARDAATGRYCHGDTPGLADLCLYAQVWNKRRFDIPTDAWPTIARIFAAVDELSGFRRAAPLAQPDAA